MTAVLEPPVIRHGSLNSYTKHGCRCADCREALRVYTAGIRRARLDRRIMRNGRWYAPYDNKGNRLQHGTASTYQNWGCRCFPCRNAHNDRKS